MTSLHAVAPDVYTVGSELHLPGGMWLPLTCTVIRLPSGGLWIHSPVRFDDATAAAIEKLGPVQFIIAPSGLHHLHGRAATERWPQARVIASPAIAPKQPGLSFESLADDPAPWGATIQAMPLGGLPTVQEWVFFHAPTRTLLVTDLLFHLTEIRGWASHFAYTLFGTRYRLANSRLFRWYIQDRAALAQSVEQMLQWPFERLIPCHGTIVEDDTHAQVRAALGPVL